MVQWRTFWERGRRNRDGALEGLETFGGIRLSVEKVITDALARTCSQNVAVSSSRDDSLFAARRRPPRRPLRAVASG